MPSDSDKSSDAVRELYEEIKAPGLDAKPDFHIAPDWKNISRERPGCSMPVAGRATSFWESR